MNSNEPTLPEESLFLQAVEIGSADERAAFLNRACGTDAELRRGVEALLRHHGEGSDFLEAPPTEVVVAAAQLTTSEPDSPALDFLTPSNDPLSLGRLGYYEVVEVLGRGGFGVVFKARDTKLDRIVAVKTLAQSLASSATARKRFVREAKAAAAVKHENVVGIYHVADDGPVPYLVMECVGGVSLEAKLQEAGTLDLPAILRIGTQVASGLAAAHKQGLVHRDVKPGNILLENGVERVKITDFGLARAADDAAITRTGEVAGTPQYMSPEQAQGLTLDARSDLFSLGSLLYAMGTGRSPFRAESTVAALRRVCDDTPRPIREINGDIPDWLAEIINRLLAKQPNERYQTATEVAELLGWHLAHVQQSAIVPSPKSTIVSRRHPSATGSRWWSVALIALLALACVIGLTEASGVTGVVPTVIRIVRGEGTLVIEVDDPTVQISLDGEELSIRGAGLQELRLLPGKYRLHATKDGQPVKDEVVTISRDGRKVVSVTLETSGGAVLRSVAPAFEQPVGELKLLAKLDWHSDVVRAVAFLPDGRRVVSVGHDSMVRVWDMANRSVVAALPVGGSLSTADVSADGRLVAVGLKLDEKAVVRVWDIEKREVVCQFASELNWNRMRFSPDGTRLVTSGLRLNYGVLWDAATGRELGRFDLGDDVGIHEAAFSPDGRLLALGKKGHVRLFDIESRDVVADVLLPNPWNVWDLEFATSGKTLATGQGGGHVSLIDVDSRRVTKTLQGSPASVHGLRFLGNDTFLLTCSYDGTLRVWDLKQQRVMAQAATGNGTNHGLFVSTDGQQVITAGGKEWDDASGSIKDHGDYALRLWRLPESVWPKASRSTAVPADTTQTPKAEAGAFAVLGGNGVAERKFDTLGEAVQSASDDDTIEIRGSGPFVSPPVKIAATPLTIRAGQGFRPVIRLDLKETQAGDALLETSGTLCVEGVELQAIGPPSQDVKPYWSVLLNALGADARLFVTNCRFVPNHLGGVPIRAAQVALLDVRNSQFVSQSCLGYSPARDSRITLHHNLIAANPFALSFPVFVPDAGKVAVNLQHNTLVAPSAVLLPLDFMPEAAEEPEGQAIKPMRIQASGNFFRGADSVLRFEQSAWFQEKHQALSGAEMETMLRAMVDWSGERNGFPSNAKFIELAALGKSLPATRPTASVADWNAFWGIADTQCIEGSIRFAGGDLLEKAKTSPELLTPEDYRLRADSAGYQAGKDGKNLGADVDRVGPGPAYEQWKKTAEYQQWLEETGQKK